MNQTERIEFNICPFTVRTSSLLRYLHLTYLDELKKYTSRDILNIRGCGLKSLREIRHIMASYGMCLKGDFLLTDELERSIILEIPEKLKQIQEEFKNLNKKIVDIGLELDHIIDRHRDSEGK